MRTYQRGKSRRRKVSTAKKFRETAKRALAFLMCLGIVLTGMPTATVFADEAGAIITLDDDGKYYTEDDTEFYDNDQDYKEDSCDESYIDEETVDSGEDLREEDEEPEEGPEDEPENETYTETDADEDTEDGVDENAGSDDGEEESEDDTEAGSEDETEDETDIESEDEEAAEEEIAGSGAGAVASSSYKTAAAKIYTDDSYEEILSDGTTIELSGKMPKGAVVKAYPVEVEIEDITVLAAYDITIFDGDGEEYEPEEDDVIEVTIENDEIREALEEETELTVFHMDDEDDEPEEIVRLPRKTKKARFRARHFSIYIVGTDDNLYELDGETPHYVYILNFYLGDVKDPDDENGYYLLSTQTVSAGEKAETPAVPDRDGYEFAGWYTEPGGEGEPFSTYKGVMPDIPDDTEEDIEIDLYAHYVEAYFVHYMSHDLSDTYTEENEVSFHTEQYPVNGSFILDTGNAETIYLLDGYLTYTDDAGNEVTTQAVTGWHDETGRPWVTGETVSGNLKLYPVVEDAYWIYFNMNGEHSIEDPEPQYVIASQTNIGNLPAPTVSGYSFDGWYTKAEGGDLVDSSTLIGDIPRNSDQTITLYAHWSVAGVAYTINIWRQKAIDGQNGIDSKAIQNGETYDDYIKYYDYAESHYVSAEQSRLKTGDTPTTSTVNNWNTYTGYGTTTDEKSAYYGFECGTNTTARTRTLNNLSTITMESDGSTIINIFYNRVTVKWTFGNGSNAIVRTGLYDTSCDWPDPDNGKRWYLGNSSYSFEAKFKILDNSTSSTFMSSSFSGRANVYYYLEVTNAAAQVDKTGEKAQEAASNGVSYTKTVGDRDYVYDKTIIIGGSTFNIESKYIGYEYAGYNTSDSGTVITHKGTSISNPAQNGKYFFFNNANEFTITLFSESKIVGVDGAGDATDAKNNYTYKVKYGEDLSKYPFPETMDARTWGPAYYYTFGGWCEDPSLTAPFTAVTMPNNNLAAYADWYIEEGGNTVTFITGTDDVKAPAVQKVTATHTAEDPGILTREGYTHVGWIDQDTGNVFNFETIIYKDTTLVAIWKINDESGSRIRYDLNVDNSNGLLEPGDFPENTDKAVNDDHFIEDIELWTIEQAFPDLSKEVTDMFIGWNTSPAGSGSMYYPDDLLTINDSNIVINEGIITLYAIWAHRNESTLILFHNYPDGYVPAAGESRMDILTGDNLTSINLLSVSGLEYHHEITVEDSGGTIHTYRFDGWSITDPGDDPTDKDVDIDADGTVAVDTLYTSEVTKTNYLYAVWLEVHNITVTKEIVNNAENYKLPEDMIFTFNWAFIDGEGNEITNQESVKIKGGESFIIPDVASGESVTITETQTYGFTTSYNGAHIDAKDNGKGTYTFTMDDDSREITVTNTVITYWTVEKELINKDEDATGKDGTYTIGDTAEFRITVTNTGDTAIGRIDVTEMLDGATFKDSDDGTYTLNDEKTVATIEDLDAGSSAVLYAEYTVQEKDIGNELSNRVTTSGGDNDDEKPGPDGKADIPTEELPTEEPEDEGGNDPEIEDDPGEEAGPGPEEPDEGSGDEEPEPDPEPESGSESGSGSGSGSGGSGSGSHGSSSYTGNVRNVNTGKTGHWILEGGYLTLPDGSHPSNEYLDVDGEVWAFYTYGYAVAKRHIQYYTDEAIAAAGYIPEVTGTWETIGWWFEYDDGTYPHDEWALLEYNGLTYWYHFDVDGWMDDGWYTENGNTYYLDPVFDGWRGHRMTGWQFIGRYWYYFSEDKNTPGIMLKDTTTPDGYGVDENGRWIAD